jgi:hypothetical protein
MSTNESSPIPIGDVATPYGLFHAIQGTYGNGATAIQLRGPNGEPVGTLSVNVPESAGELADDEFFAKTYSENEGFVQPALASGLFEDTGRVVRAGYLSFPVWRVCKAPRVGSQSLAEGAHHGSPA